jgi:hypothetical protein
VAAFNNSPATSSQRGSACSRLGSAKDVGAAVGERLQRASARQRDRRKAGEVSVPVHSARLPALIGSGVTTELPKVANGVIVSQSKTKKPKRRKSKNLARAKAKELWREHYEISPSSPSFSA